MTTRTLIAVVLVAVLLVGGAVGITYLVTRSGGSGRSESTSTTSSFENTPQATVPIGACAYARGIGRLASTPLNDQTVLTLLGAMNLSRGPSRSQRT